MEGEKEINQARLANYRSIYIAVVLATSLRFVPSLTKETTNTLPVEVPVASVPVDLKFVPKVSV